MPNNNSRSKYKIVLDTETTNSLDDPLVYDLGFSVVDRFGNVYESRSLVIREVFYSDFLMSNAFYGDKIPQYKQDIADGKRQLVSLYEARTMLHTIAKHYNVTEFFAYNARFDLLALKTTQCYLTKSKYRWFLPYDSEVFCIHHIAAQAFMGEPQYVATAIQQGWLTEKESIKSDAQTCYRYLTNDFDFVESHTGLEDVEIETYILAKAFALRKSYNRKINRGCYRIPQKTFDKMFKEGFFNV